MELLSTNLGMLFMCSLAMTMPTLYDVLILTRAEELSPNANGQQTPEDLWMSRVCSALLVVMYVQFLYFQLYTHSSMRRARLRHLRPNVVCHGTLNVVACM